MTSLADLSAAAAAYKDRTIEFRRRLHRRPEIGLDLPLTRQAVLDEIADLGLAVRLSTTTSAVVATLEGSRPGPTIILRGDMDALPLREDTGLEFASETPGTMHACGHDTHVAMLAGGARLLAERRDEIAGRVVFFFQPGEEGQGGARYAIEEGLLDPVEGSAVAGAFALHISSGFASGTINTRRGPLLAAADTLKVTVRGRGGHASAPHMAADPIPVACEIVTSLQTALSRRISVFDPAVVTVAHIEAGTTDNVIPATAWFEGTIRTLSEEVRKSVHELIARVANGVAAAHDMTADVEIDSGYPVTVNDDDFTDTVFEIAAGVVGEDLVAVMDNPILGAEDFSYVLQRYPGTMAFIGACPPGIDPAEAPPNHSNLVVFDEEPLAAGAAMYAAVALHYLSA